MLKWVNFIVWTFNSVLAPVYLILKCVNYLDFQKTYCIFVSEMIKNINP